ncbi:MAG: DUF1178 family protein [Hyphomicrobiaceae bacterium]|nr:DUF1178 family protein [Hyphomicrobiaceae bacterium]
MIRYRLVCKKGHEFEAWFRNSATYDRQAKRKQVTCPDCGSNNVEKALMAPGIVSKSESAQPVAAPAPAMTQAAGMPEEQRKMLEALRKVRDEVLAKSEYVGPRFAEEARKIHYEESEPRGIYGEASPSEVQELEEEGVPCYPIPVLPEDRN